MADESKKAKLDLKSLELTPDGKVVIDDPELFTALSDLKAKGEVEEEGMTDINIYRCGSAAL
ncbi:MULTISPECIES: hypothetical protein [Deinococcus]|uniref:Uncharacterized protein n=1 Tax=Deinococcus ruber TaxID=1848197 RepID=A0A918F3I8_9DEIO|nr:MULTISPECIES: hypothetical protein [Deinococcus]ULH17462.1 hypothetical protein MF271_20610 [Deinococcus sp. KNUC1210]GGR04053.1 hypothetical protein GCM10008957_16270 [Deinococcus ruber]